MTTERIRITESLSPNPIDWKDQTTGYTVCPGKHLHSNPSTKRDLKIKIDGAPTAKCPHTSCGALVDEFNWNLRSQIGKAEAKKNGNSFQKSKPAPPTAEQIQQSKDRDRAERMKLQAAKSLPTILAEHRCTPDDFWERSVYRLDGDCANDWRLLLRLYSPTDVIWIGGPKDSASDDSTDAWKAKAATHFRTVADWLKEPQAPEQHICPNPFKPGVHSRSIPNIAATRFLIVESDHLSKNEFCAVLQWLQKFLWLRAVVDTAGKSLHGWFEYPDAATLAELKTILPALKCDKELFGIAHTCRLPGAMRDGKRQHLVFLDLEGIR